MWGKKSVEAPPPQPESRGAGVKGIKTLRHPVGHPRGSRTPHQGLVLELEPQRSRLELGSVNPRFASSPRCGFTQSLFTHSC